MCAVNVSVEAVIASRDRRRSGVSQVGDAWRPWDCISSPLGRVRHADPGFFDLFPYNVFPPGTPGDPSVAPKKRRGPRRIPPPLFSGARTRGPIIEFARVDRMRAFVCRRGTADRNPTSPPTRRRSVLVLGGRRPQTGLRVLRRDRVDQRVWQSQTYAPTKVLGSSRLASRCITNY